MLLNTKGRFLQNDHICCQLYNGNVDGNILKIEQRR